MEKTLFNLISGGSNEIGGLNLEAALTLYGKYSDLIEEVKELGIKRDYLGNITIENLVGKIKLDSYVNASKDTFNAKLQKGSTCYANAIAAVIHLANSRVFGRIVEDFFTIRDKIIKIYGWDGGNVKKVLQDFCPKYNLKFNENSEKEAKIAVDAKRPQVFCFYLYDNEWDLFSQFYKNNPKGILKKENLRVKEKVGELGGHAVVLMKNENNHLYLMNSWGDSWADKGFFRIENADTLEVSYSTQFYDIFWTIDMLTSEEISNYENATLNKFRDLEKKLPPEITVDYKCPLCNKLCKANQVFGDLKKAKCPNCHRFFIPKLEHIDGRLVDLLFTFMNFK